VSQNKKGGTRGVQNATGEVGHEHHKENAGGDPAYSNKRAQSTTKRQYAVNVASSTKQMQYCTGTLSPGLKSVPFGGPKPPRERHQSQTAQSLNQY